MYLLEVIRSELEQRVMAAVKSSVACDDPPASPGRRGRTLRPRGSSSVTTFGKGGAGGGLSAALLSNLCFVHSTDVMWKLLDQAMASYLVSPLHTLALLTPRSRPI